MNEAIKKADTPTLWRIMTDLSVVMERYTPEQENTAFMFWYGVYKELEKELDKRMILEG